MSLRIKSIPGVPEEIPRFLNNRKSLSANKSPIDEWRLLRKDGTSVLVEISENLLPDNSLQAFVRDITERKRTEEPMLLMKYTIDHVADSAAQIASDARFVFVNNALCQSLGYTREELLELTVHDIDPNFPEEMWADHWNNLRAQKSLTVESTHQRKDGSVFPIALSLSILEYNGQEYSFAYGRALSPKSNEQK